MDTSLYLLTNAHNLKATSSFSTVSTGALSSTRSHPRGGNDSHSIIILLLVFRLFDDVRLFTVDCSPHVRILSRFHKTAIFPDQTFIEVASIAIWNKNKIAMVMAISLWGANAAFFIYCKLVLTCYMGYRALTPTWSGHSCRACKYSESIPMTFNHALTVSLVQLRSSWAPVEQACVVTNLPSTIPNLIAIPVSDISLLLIMLVGLFRLRGDGIGIVGMARVLWRQVILVLASCVSFNSLIYIFASGRVSFGSCWPWWLRFRQW